MIFKCKICGGSLDVHIGERTAVCEYCGVRQSIPSFIDVKAQEIYNIAGNYLAHNEFDKAENLYDQILIDNKADADAYWNILMCRYGVTYVKDPASGKYIPTCNRTLYAPIFNDENYKNAVKYADEKQRALFETNAKIIDDIQKGILSVSSKEKPFDIFISYKETDVNGARTKDSIVAQDLYEKLTAEGYKVFFSRITLEDKIGTEYEPYIYAALASSKVMITVCSSKENIESVWVKNEWSRFLSFMGKDSGKTFIPLYFDMDRSALPDDFAHMPSYDIKTDGFEQDLIRGIKKLIPLPVMLLERRKKRNKILRRIGIAVAACAVIGVICAIPWFMKLPDYNAAMQLYYDKNYPEATWAFEDLGSYRNSEKMKEKCELSWRKSLATVATINDLGSRSNGSYYISSNGTVEMLTTGTANENTEIDAHGKIVSLGDGNPIYSLHEDGYADNISENNHIESISEWHNIVQISPVFNSTNIALRSDGKMLYGNVDVTNPNDEWLTGISEWENIVGFDYCFFRHGLGLIRDGAIIGINSNGTLRGVFMNDDEHFLDGNPQSILEKFKDVKDVEVFIDGDVLGYDSLYLAALATHGTIITYGQGEFNEFDANDVVDINIDYSYNDHKMEIYYLTSDCKVLKKGDNKALLEDVVYYRNEYYVSRNGSLYFQNEDGDTKFEKCNAKSCVYDEWIERMK